MDFDTSMVMDYLIPDSFNDFGAIQLWILIILLVSIVIMDIRFYLNNRKTSKKTECIKLKESKEKFNTIKQEKRSKEEDNLEEYKEIKNKVDNIIEIYDL